jgi:predicted nucleic acid-binding protein
MIIFDANILYGVTRANPKFDVLRALKHSNTYSVGIPWMVLEELTAKQTLEYVKAYKRASEGVADLNSKSPWGRHALLPSFNLEEVKQYWRGQYEEVLEVIETSGKSAKEALAREAYCEKPAKANADKKGGARDVAIWLTVVDYLKEHPDEEVFFVSNNPNDFGDGAEFPELMSGDLGDMRGRLTMMASFDEVISRFTEKIQVSDAEIKSRLEAAASDSSAIVDAYAGTSLRAIGFFGGTRVDNWEPITLMWRTWLLQPSAIIRGVTNGSAHKIGAAEWYTATVDWLLIGSTSQAAITYANSGTIRPEDVHVMVPIACQWQTKILFNAGANPKLTIVESRIATRLDPADRDALQPLLDATLNSSAQQVSPAMTAFMIETHKDDNWDALWNSMIRTFEENARLNAQAAARGGDGND